MSFLDRRVSSVGLFLVALRRRDRGHALGLLVGGGLGGLGVLGVEGFALLGVVECGAVLLFLKLLAVLGCRAGKKRERKKY